MELTLREVIKVTGDGVPQGASEPVRTRLLTRVAEAAKVIASVAQAGYYMLKSWQELR
ncbi:hypothetical protein AB0L68_30950 [Streptomyces sp. NPDC052164]|uniref:hypothetical protein n=1 Tax=Streptomyces sp. NPDC052164 TaxID=3155529 RepID=UPI00341224FA